LREGLNGLHALRAYGVTIDFGPADLFNAGPVQAFASCKAHAFSAQGDASVAYTKVKRGFDDGLTAPARLQQWPRLDVG